MGCPKVLSSVWIELDFDVGRVSVSKFCIKYVTVLAGNIFKSVNYLIINLMDYIYASLLIIS